MSFSHKMARTFLWMMLILVFGGNLAAQSSDKSQDEERGFTFYEQFQGSSNTLGQVMKLDTSVGYNFNKYWGLDVGMPFYFVHASADASAAGLSSNNGIGDAYVDLRLTLRNPLLNFASTLTGRAPTGDTAKGLSTGRATFDWNNHFDRGLGRIRPFANLGVANSISDTLFFSRPFTSLGLVSHLEGGVGYKIWHSLRAGASAYAILPSGQQKIFSKLIRSQMSGSNPAGGMTGRHGGGVFENASETIGNADIARDNGYSVWAEVTPMPYMDFEVGYNRSVHYDLNTLSFGVGINIGSLARMVRSL